MHLEKLQSYDLKWILVEYQEFGYYAKTYWGLMPSDVSKALNGHHYNPFYDWMSERMGYPRNYSYRSCLDEEVVSNSLAKVFLGFKLSEWDITNLLRFVCCL